MEREGKFYKELDFGFFVYELDEPYIYLSDVYIKPELRKEGKCKEIVRLVESIGRENNCNKLITTYSLEDENKDRSRQVIQNCGFNYLKVYNTLVWFEKDIS